MGRTYFLIMGLLQKFQDFIKTNNLFSPKDKLLLAVSGGLDSVVLCELCKQAGYDFSVAHCNFKLRGKESERDEVFVKSLGTRYNVEVKVMMFETEKMALENKLSIQEAARNLRYEWFVKLINELSNQPPGGKTDNLFLLTAHHADDNNETLLMNFFRGTGLHGLTGIPVKSGYIRRPLLSFTKAQLLAFAKENNLQWVEDSSNESSKYTRNFFRNELIPAIRKVFPQVNENLADNISRFNEIERLYKTVVGDIIKKLCRRKGSEIHIPVKQLMGYKNRALIYEIISGYGFGEKQVDELIKLSESESGKYMESSEHHYRIIRHRHWFIISPVANGQSENIIVEEGTGILQFSAGLLQITKTQKSKTLITNDEHSAFLDMREISFPLLLRKWKTGDYFYPLGMKKKKKIARFLIDLKLSRTEKENIWVLETNKRILWVVGRRIDERFKVGKATKNVLHLQYSSGQTG
jgi:tRNA(Ile)-lysidine synthase